MVLWGYAVPSDQFKVALQSVKDTIRDPLVPLYEVCVLLYEYIHLGQLFSR
jgi:hypothetical protein